MLRIVHVEDDDDFALLTEDKLRGAGFTRPVERCKNGIIAMNYLERVEPENAPHVILLNLLMSGMRGLAVLNWLRTRASDRDLAVYLLSASDHLAYLRRMEANRGTGKFDQIPIFEKLFQSLDTMMSRRNDQNWKGVMGLVPDRSSERVEKTSYETVQTKRLSISFAANLKNR
jgi:CheY-like chemotaxis protein